MSIIDVVYRLTDAQNKAKKESTENKYLADYLGSRNDYSRAHAGIAQNTLDFAPAMSQEELRKAKTTNDFLPGTLGSEIGLKRAQTGLAAEQTRMLPLETLIKGQQGSQSASRFGGAYQMSKALEAMSPAARELWIANNQEQYNQMLMELGNKQNTNMLTPQVMDKFFPGMGLASTAIPPSAPSQPNMGQGMGGAPMPNAPPPNRPPAPGMAPSGMPPSGMAASNMPPPSQFNPSTPEQIQQVKLANQMAANKSLTTNATQRQLEGAIQVENVINDPTVQRQVQNAAKYAGALGKGKAFADALSQQNPQAYEDYLALKNQTMVLIENRIKTLDGMGATDSQREELKGLYEKTADALTSNPAQFVTQFNKLGTTLDTIAKSVQKSATPVSPVNRLEGFKPVGGDMVTMVSSDGKRWRVPAASADVFRKNGYKEAK